MCEKKTTRRSSRAVIASMFERGNPADALSHRLFQCTHATKCRCLCERLMKDAGKATVHCWSNYPDRPAKMVYLYEALENPAFECPLGLF